ncbi:MAG: MATE family efflux transporter [Candidatus Cryptobacteroides sp.]
MLYVRMLFIMVVSLYTSRVVLQTLGVEDFGIFNVVGGVITMFAFINSSMVSSTQRYLNFELAKGNMPRLRSVFRTSLQIHALIALLIIVLGETLGLWFLMEKLVIPQGRMGAAMWVYQCSIVSCAVNIMSAPYNADIIAHEKMSAFAYISILEVTLKLGIVFLLVVSPVDKLIAYAVLLLLVQLTIRFIYSFYCRRHFEESSPGCDAPEACTHGTHALGATTPNASSPALEGCPPETTVPNTGIPAPAASVPTATAATAAIDGVPAASVSTAIDAAPAVSVPTATAATAAIDGVPAASVSTAIDAAPAVTPPAPRFDKALFREMSGFAGWSFFGNLASILYTQGLNMMLNIFFGPVVNAARGIAVQVQSAVQQFVSGFQTAVNPQITKNFAVGNLEQMHSLMFRSARFSFLLLFFLSLPVLLETDFLLALWLKEVPENAVTFTQIMICISLIYTTANPCVVANQATGRVKVYQIVVGGILLTILPISYLVLKAGAPAYSVFIVHFCVESVAQLARMLLLRKLIDLPLREYIKNIYLPILASVALALACPLAVHLSMEEGWLRFIAVGLTSVVSTGLGSFFAGLTRQERNFFIDKALRIFRHRQ